MWDPVYRGSPPFSVLISTRHGKWKRGRGTHRDCVCVCLWKWSVIRTMVCDNLWFDYILGGCVGWLVVFHQEAHETRQGKYNTNNIVAKCKCGERKVTCPRALWSPPMWISVVGWKYSESLCSFWPFHTQLLTCRDKLTSRVHDSKISCSPFLIPYFFALLIIFFWRRM